MTLFTRLALTISCALAVAPAYARENAVVVAVIDSGVAKVGPLQDRVIASYDMTGLDRTKILNSHGTSVAAIIVRNSDAPVQIVSLRADRINCVSGIPSCEMNLGAISSGIRKAIELKVDIIQISSYGRLSKEIKDAVTAATQAGIHVVFCAGNKGGVSVPLAMSKRAGPRFHVVGSLDAKGRISKFSGRDMLGSGGMSWRPGENVETVDLKGETVHLNGTSFAAPLLSADLSEQIASTR